MTATTATGFASVFILIFLPPLAWTQGKESDQRGKSAVGIFQNETPAHTYDIILSRPTQSAVTISILTQLEIDGQIVFGKDPSDLKTATPLMHFVTGEPGQFELKALKADTRYYYQFRYTDPLTNESKTSPIGYFSTQRNAGSSFVFTVQADSHLDENTSTTMYRQTLANMAVDSADFLIDLGDTWMTDKYRDDFKGSAKQYVAQRYYFGLLCHSSPLFLTLGNHDGESGRMKRATGELDMMGWATSTRKRYYANPRPDRFYAGSSDENYYAWEWGSALFIVLDPFRYTKDPRDPWQRTLGDTQYHFLKKILQESRCNLRFVFIHNLVGGVDNKGVARGGAEASRFFEWGGLDRDGTRTFSSKRPGWKDPIHELLVAQKVNVVFHGHDHLYATQERDGIVYQALPQPGAMRYGNIQSASEYGYETGTILNAPGYLSILVEPDKATISFIQSSTDQRHQNREVLHHYTVTKK